MDKFSKIRYKDEFSNKREKVVHKDEHFSIIQFEDWKVLKGKDCVVCIPFLIETNQMILRKEYIPSFKYADGQEYHVTLVCGGIENGESPKSALLRELEEEAGIVLSDDYQLDEMKPLFISKSSSNKYFPYLLPLNEKDFTEVMAKGDGSKVEKMSKSVKVDIKFLGSINSSDLITDYMLLKLKSYLNL